MIDEEETNDAPAPAPYAPQKRKRLMILLLPLLIVIGISVGLYFALSSKYSSNTGEYNIVHYSKENKEDIAVFYDMPEMKANVSGKERDFTLRLKLNFEMSSIEDLKVIEALSGKLSDVVLGHIVELSEEELRGSAGMYWLKEELLYRLNLAATPAKIKNLNFSVFELQ